MNIRAATPADADDIARIVNTAYEVERFFVAGNRTSPADVRSIMRDSRFLVAELDDHHVVACINVATRGDRGYFGMLAVEPASQGQGIGRALIDIAERGAREAGCRAMDIKVVDLRTDLLAFYARLGYLPVGTEPYEHRPVLRDCHFVTMEKLLPGWDAPPGRR